MSTNCIISRLRSRFDNATGGAEGRVHPDLITRDIGGHFRNNQPYISGYFQIMFGLPEGLFTGDYASTASKWLHSTCEGFTPHTQTLNKVDIMGQGGIGSSYPVNVTTTREFTLTFREMQNLPMLNILKQWCSVFDPFTGVSPLPGKNFIPPSYKGWCAVVQTKPVRANCGQQDIEAQDIEEAYIYQGVFPTNIPVDTASASDITGNDTVQLSSTFSFDGAPLTTAEEGVTMKIVELFSGFNVLEGGDSGTYSKYLKAGTDVKQWVGPVMGVTSTAPMWKG